MQPIDLRSLQHNAYQWDAHYLAWLASACTQRDSITCAVSLEMNRKLNWLIVCLDGAPERMRHRINGCVAKAMEAHTWLAPAEHRFRSLIADLMHQPALEPTVYVQAEWWDGLVLGFEDRARAVDLALELDHQCAQINFKETLPWTQQFHVRGGIGSTVRQAFSGLLHAKRDQLIEGSNHVTLDLASHNLCRLAG